MGDSNFCLFGRVAIPNDIIGPTLMPESFFNENEEADQLVYFFLLNR